MLCDSKAFSGFAIDDLDAARTFYGETLGLDVDDEGPGLVLHLNDGRGRRSSTPPDLVPASTRSSTSTSTTSTRWSTG